jgi:hypothetical protein
MTTVSKSDEYSFVFGGFCAYFGSDILPKHESYRDVFTNTYSPVNHKGKYSVNCLLDTYRLAKRTKTYENAPIGPYC